MSQHDMVVANQARSLVRTDFNNALLALIGNSSGVAAPGTTYAYQWWLDTTTNLLKIRNAANSAWVTIGTPSVSNLGMLLLTGGTLTGTLLAAVGLAASAPGLSFSGDTDSGFYWVSANKFRFKANDVEYMEISAAGITFMQTGATTLPSGTTAQQPTPTNGMMRYNSDLTKLEAYTNGSWKRIINGVTYPFASTEFNDSVDVGQNLKATYDFGGVQSISPIFPHFPWTSPTKLSNPASLPAGTGRDVASTPNGEFVSVFHSTTPFLTNYQRIGTELVKLANPGTLPTGTVYGGAISPNGEFLAVGHDVAPGLTIYQRSGSTWTKIANPATLPTSDANNGGRNCCWSPNSEFLCVSAILTPFILIYQRSGTTFTKLANPATLPGASGQRAAFSPSGRFLCFPNFSTPKFIIYERTAGTTFTALTAPATLPAGTPDSAAWSPDEQFLACTSSTTPFITIYQRSGTTFTKLANPSSLPNATAKKCQFSSDGKYLLVGHTGTASDTLLIYSISGTTFTRISPPSSAPSSDVYGLNMSENGEFVFCSLLSSPYIEVYQTASNLPTSSILTISKKARTGT